MRNQLLFLPIFIIFELIGKAEIVPIKPEQFNQAKHLVVETQIEVWQLPYDFDGAIKEWGKSDLDDIQEIYLDNDGIFLVLIDNDTVVGTGAIKKWNDEICELRRLWFKKEYRSQGFGKQMVDQLLGFARNKKYKKIRLDVYDPDKQPIAMKFFTKLGFKEIVPYKDNGCKLYMERDL